MNLTGILKSILLVAASMIIWQTPMTLLQASGYSIALAAMFCYSTGGLDAAKGHLQWLKENVKILFSSEQTYQVVTSSSDDRDILDVERGDPGLKVHNEDDENAIVLEEKTVTK